MAANDQSSVAEDTRRHMLAGDPGHVHVSEFPNVVQAERHQRTRMICEIYLHDPKMLVILGCREVHTYRFHLCIEDSAQQQMIL